MGCSESISTHCKPGYQAHTTQIREIILTLVQVTNFPLVSPVDPWENPNILTSHNSYPAGIGENGKGDS